MCGHTIMYGHTDNIIVQGLEYGQKAWEMCGKIDGNEVSQVEQKRAIQHILHVTTSLKGHLRT